MPPPCPPPPELLTPRASIKPTEPPMSSPLVSVVVPTYNQPALLLETLETVFAQTLTDYEVVVVNDGSTDDTADRLRRLGERVRVIEQPNSGIGAARNRGIAEARGKYVAMLDHDDLWRPEKLATQVAYFEAHPECSIVSVPWALSDDPSRCMFDLDRARADGGLIANPVARLASGDLFLITSSIMFQRDKAAGLRYAEHRPCFEDHPFQIPLFARGPAAVAGDRILMVYRVHEANTSKQASYWYHGQRIMRALDRAGHFDALRHERADLLRFFARFGRSAVMWQLLGGRRLRAASLYAQEFTHQAREGRLKFLSAFPLLLLLPVPVVRRVWGVPPAAAR